MASSSSPLLASSTAVCDGLDCSAKFTPLLLGVASSCFLMGMILSIANRTAALFHERQFRWKRISILLVVLLQLAQTGTDLSRVIKIFCIHFGEFDYFSRARIEDAVAPFLGVVIQLHTQFFLLRRAYIYGTVAGVSRPLKIGRSLFLALCILISGASGLGAALEIKLLGTLRLVSPGNPDAQLFGHLIMTWLVSSSFIDVSLCALIIVELLQTRRSVTGSTRSRRGHWVVGRLIFTLVRSGILPAAFQTATAIVWQVRASRTKGAGTGSWVYFPILMLPKIYTLTYLAIVSCSRPLRLASFDPFDSPRARDSVPAPHHSPTWRSIITSPDEDSSGSHTLLDMFAALDQDAPVAGSKGRRPLSTISEKPSPPLTPTTGPPTFLIPSTPSPAYSAVSPPTSPHRQVVGRVGESNWGFGSREPVLAREEGVGESSQREVLDSELGDYRFGRQFGSLKMHSLLETSPSDDFPRLKPSSSFSSRPTRPRSKSFDTTTSSTGPRKASDASVWTVDTAYSSASSFGCADAKTLEQYRSSSYTPFSPL